MNTTIRPEELAQKIDAGEAVELIDVRTPAEYREIHIPAARNLPLDQLKAEDLGEYEKPLYVVCRSGARAERACQQLGAQGVPDVVSVEGGTLGWEAAGLPVERGKKTISLERQVRIAAGLLVLIGAVLGYFVNPNFIGIAAFVGAGLAFAGITDTCGMAMILAKMPWNQVGNQSPA